MLVYVVFAAAPCLLSIRHFRHALQLICRHYVTTMPLRRFPLTPRSFFRHALR